MTKELAYWINRVNETRTVVSSRLSSLTHIEDRMRKLAKYDEWTNSQEVEWMSLEKQFKFILNSLSIL
jgi:hypothetical protein